MGNEPAPKGFRSNISEAVTTVLSRIGIGRSLGFQMNGKRDLYDTFGWNNKPTHQDYVAKYRRQDITKRVIDAPVNALWSDPPKITGDDTFEKAWNDLLAQVAVFYNLQRLDKLAGLGKYAVMVIGVDDAQELDQPVNTRKGRKILYLQPYSEGAVTIERYDEDPQSVRYGLPLEYKIEPGTFDVQNGQITRSEVRRLSFNVHWQRVLHIAENALESDVIGYSRLEPIYNVLDDILKVSGGSAEMFWLTANRGLHIDVDKDMEMAEGDAKSLADEVDEYSNNLRRTIRTRGVSVKALGSEISDPRGTFDVQLSLLASCTGIPKRVLAGSEAGQLASQQDRANWAQRVAERITEYGQPIVLIPLIRRLIDLGILPIPKTMTIEWPDAFKMNPLERAQTSAQMARTAANLAKTLKTVADINHQNAVDSKPTQTPAGGGGFFGNADPEAKPPVDKAGKPDKTKPSKSSDKPVDGNPDAQTQSDTIETPPLYDVEPPKLVLLTEEECRSIIGFGKHMPVFDSKDDSNTEHAPSDAAPGA